MKRDVALGPHDVVLDHRADGTIVARSPYPLAPYARATTDWLDRWADIAPSRTFLAERVAGGTDWRTIGYRETRLRVRSLAQGLLDLGSTARNGLAIVAENSIDHALLALAAQYVGVPYTPLSPNYVLLARDFTRLRSCLDTFRPAVVFIADATRFEAMLTGDVIASDAPLIVGRRSAGGRDAVPFDTLLRTEPSAAVDRANATLTPDTVAKVLFTSGSTGMPKGVLTTHRMLCSNQQMCLQAFPFWTAGMTMVDWVPWSHTAGSNQTFNMVLANGGTMYIDDGAPTPERLPLTIRNLREISPTIYFSVPRGLDMLAGALENDAALRSSFFRDLRMIWFGGAALAAPVHARLLALARAEGAGSVLITSAFGSTETAPSALFANYAIDDPRNIGVPLPGVELKLVPADDAYEVRVRGPLVTPGYAGRDDLTAAAFDEQCFLRIGDLVRFADDTDPSAGFLFAGRLGEMFKLSSGTWVDAPALREALLGALAPLVPDLVVCGADQCAVTALLVAPDGGVSEALRDAVRVRLTEYRARHPASSRHVAAAVFLDPPLDPGVGEVTEKGSISAAVVRRTRAASIEQCYRNDDSAVLSIDENLMSTPDVP